MATERVAQKLTTLPDSPGVYIFRGRQGQTLYIGKARSLRSRVRSYFQAGTSDERAFIPFLDSEVADLETIVVANEKEAALLENELIKEEQPRYNVKLRDDKSFLNLRLDPKEAWPRLRVVRRPKPDGAYYFGPYPSASTARQALRVINRYFQLRTCTDMEMKRRVRPCLQYQIKRCPGPCVLEVDRAGYGEQVESVRLFLQGKYDELRERLQGKMQRASDELAFELAASYRDQLRALERVQEGQRIATVRDIDQDVVGFFRKDAEAETAVLSVRSGKLVHVRSYSLSRIAIPDEELIASFIRSYYETRGDFPDELLLPIEIEAMDGVAEALSERRGKRVKVRVPRRGGGAEVLRLAMENATHAYREKQRAKESAELKLQEVQRVLRLPSLPTRIECIDISHTSGQDPVACIVALRDGEPDRARYRSYQVKVAKGGDDYGSIFEVLCRRFQRREENKWDLPDLLLIDGGPGQLASALQAAKDEGVEDLPIASLAKERVNALGEELVDRVYLPGQKNPIPLHRHASLRMLALARDEAHRASNELRLRRRRKEMRKSTLDEVRGVGPKTRQKLLRYFGSIDALRVASQEELCLAGASKAQAAALRAHFERR